MYLEVSLSHSICAYMSSFKETASGLFLQFLNQTNVLLARELAFLAEADILQSLIEL